MEINFSLIILQLNLNSKSNGKCFMYVRKRKTKKLVYTAKTNICFQGGLLYLSLLGILLISPMFSNNSNIIASNVLKISAGTQ